MSEKESSPQTELPDSLQKKAGENAELAIASVIEMGAVDRNKLFKVIVETPAGSRNKYDYDPETGLFELNSILPAGMSFPYDFGFLPSTHCADGDPLDVLVLTDEPTFAGCLVRCRIIGVLEAEQTERGGKPYRNDRVLGVHYKSVLYGTVKAYKDLPEVVLHQLEHFFKAYNEPKGKTFKALGWYGPEQAYKVIQQAMSTFDRQQQKQAG